MCAAIASSREHNSEKTGITNEARGKRIDKRQAAIDIVSAIRC